MNDKPFLDTTILLYTLAESDPRSVIAEGVLLSGGVISVQVLNEFTAVARRKLRMSWEEISEALSAIRLLCDPPVPLTVELHERALRIATQRGFHIYDCLIVAAAQAAGCTVLLSEDMQHAQTIDSLTIRNPFHSGL